MLSCCMQERFDHGRYVVFVMPLCDRTVSQWLQAHGPMARGEAREACVGLFRALAFVHAKGYVHR